MDGSRVGDRAEACDSSLSSGRTWVVNKQFNGTSGDDEKFVTKSTADDIAIWGLLIDSTGAARTRAVGVVVI